MTIKNRDPSNCTTIKTIYYARTKYRVKEQAGRSQMQHLMRQLREHNYVEWHRACEVTGDVTELFWSHPIAGDMLRVFPKVLMMDYTYKTNRYRFPLLQIVGVTSTEMTYSVAFVFMQSEKEDNYIWALEKLKGMMDPESLPEVIVTDRELSHMNAIAKVFPCAKNMLCRWHIQKNVLANCKKHFDDAHWQKVLATFAVIMYAPTIEVYDERVRELKRDFMMYPTVLEYVDKTWLAPHKERFVCASTDCVMHPGNYTTSSLFQPHYAIARRNEDVHFWS